MKKRSVIVILSLCLIFSQSFALIAGADFGDYGGDSDYGYDYDNDYDYDYDYDDDDDYNWNYGGSSGSSYGGSSSGDSGGSLLFGIIVFALIVFFVLRKAGLLSGKGKGGGKGNVHNRPVVAPGAQPTPKSSLYSPADYLKVDPGFSASDFNEKLANLYVRFQNAWAAKDLSELRPYLTDAFFAQMDRQLDNYRRNHQTNVVERISVLGTEIYGWKQEQNDDVMIARLRTRITDYVVNDANGAVVRGSKTAEKFMDYEWELVRAKGKKTGADAPTAVHNCPNCGAVLNINRTARCEYCGSIVTVDDYDWVVRNIKAISQRTSG